MTPRQLVVDALAAVLPHLHVDAYARHITPSRPTLMVLLDQVQPQPAVPLGRAHVFHLWLIVPATKAGPADDDLDARLVTVLDALDLSPVITWTDARRAIYEDAQPAYDITVTVEIDPQQ